MRTFRWIGLGIAALVALGLIVLPFVPWISGNMIGKIMAASGALLGIWGLLPSPTDFREARAKQAHIRRIAMEMDGVEAQTAALERRTEEAQEEANALTQAIQSLRLAIEFSRDKELRLDLAPMRFAPPLWIFGTCLAMAGLVLAFAWR